MSGGKIIIEKDKKILTEIPKNTIEGLVILSSVQITSQAIVEFLNIGIPVTWIFGTQKFFRRLESMSNVNGVRQATQIKMSGSVFYLSMAPKII
ncbi:MAG: CRISPR-associated endonuclease Cas1 [Selenomonadaceae bacterium]|nr:CRISPR-associated endonuclease Cas1 [Selenomonadaceae bacterium]